MRKITVKIITLVMAVALAFFVTYEITEINQQSLLDFSAPNLTASPNTTSFTLNLYLSPSYFEPRGQLYVAVSSPYTGYLKEFNLSMSLDGETWTVINVTPSPFNTNNKSGYTCLGYVDLTQLRIPIYGEYFLPPQLSGTPSNASEQEILNNLMVYVRIDPIITPYDLTLIVIVFVSLLGASFSILDSFLSALLRTNEPRGLATVSGKISATAPGTYPIFIQLIDSQTSDAIQITFADRSNPRSYKASVPREGSYHVQIGWSDPSGTSRSSDMGTIEISRSSKHDFSV